MNINKAQEKKPEKESLTSLDKEILNNQNDEVHASQAPSSIEKKRGGFNLGHCECMKVMVVDDVSMNRFILCELMQHLDENLQCLEAQNGLDCLVQIKEFYRNKKCPCEKGIRIIFMDIQMPIMDGYECNRELKKMMWLKQIPRIPIVAISAFPDEIDRCIKEGMADFVDKPASIQRIEEVLNALLK
mmetsp:Transcript_26617/g.19959  ORF Transcript_26617/g.19959 Transcript_26617/m.19959 type:complete len:187 (-) Transcript_26617:12-572(-)